MSTQIANFASCLGKYDGSVLSGAGTTLDPSSVAIGNYDLSLNSGYLSNPNAFTTPAVGNGTGFSVTGWFNPGGAQASNFTPIFDMSGASATATNHITLCVSGNSLTPALVATFNAQTSVYVPSGAVSTNAWNFFGYTVCCSGGVQLVQNLTVNGTTISVTGGTYAPLTVANTYVGYGQGIYANYFQGKIDDFRYYGRVLCPMEMRVLYSYAYGKTNVSATAPYLGTVTVGTLTATTAPLIFPSTGTYSYLGVTRTFAGVTTSFNVSPSLMVSSGSKYVLTDTVAFTSSPSAYYVFTPYILGSPGVPQALTATIPAPSAITNVLAYNAGVGVFDVSWIGGVGVGVTYTYDVSSSGAIVSSGNYTTTALGLNLTRITLTDTAQKTYMVVVKATNVVGTVLSATSNTITTNSPILFVNLGVKVNSSTVTASSSITTGTKFLTGTSVANSKTYAIYAFGDTSNQYTINYTCNSTSSIYILAVGGGGSGGNFGGGGGGAGAVLMNTYPIGTGTSSITITVGSGGNAVDTTIYITSTSTTINANGGGPGGGNFTATALSNTKTSSGGGLGYSNLNPTVAIPGNTAGGTIYANNGGNSTTNFSGGGGGAGTSGSNGTSAIAPGAKGGNGIQLTASYSPIGNFAPTTYSSCSTYYWGGGGGGCGGRTNGSADGGLGGGGGGGWEYGFGGGRNGVGGTGGIGAGGTSNTDTGTTGTAGNGGTNTGSGGGGSWITNASGAGGSGIVVIAFPIS